MPITVEWKNKSERVLLMRYAGHWSWDDFYNADASMRKMIDDVKDRSHLIIDVTKNVWFPPDIAQHTDRIVSALDPRLGIIILVGRQIEQEMLSLLAAENDIITTRYGFAYDVESAQQAIDRRRRAN